MPALDPRRLETFRVVATTGQVSAAARALHLSQPAVTSQVRQLEAECGRALFERTPRGMQLNAAGQTLLSYATALRSTLDAAQAAIAVDETPRGQLTLCASTTTASALVPPLLTGFLARFPEVSVRVQVGNTRAVIESVRAEGAMLGLVEGPARAQGVRIERYLDDELLPVVSADSDAGRWKDLRWLWREVGSGTRAVVERGLKSAGCRHRPVKGDLELGSSEAILRSVELGLGMGFLSRLTAGPALDAGRVKVVRVPRLRITRAFSFVLAGGAPAGLAGRFLAHARTWAPSSEGRG